MFFREVNANSNNNTMIGDKKPYHLNFSANPAPASNNSSVITFV